MKVVILGGGKGTRLREASEVRPKPMVEIGGYPIVWHVMKMYARYGYRDFVVCLGYLGNVVREYFLNYHAMRNDFTINLGSRERLTFHGTHNEEEWNVTLADTGLDSLTAERVDRVRQYLGDDPFMVSYCDGVADLDVGALVDFHRKCGRAATLTGVRDVSRFGVVRESERGKVDGFKEKPQVKERINAGYFVFENRVLDRLEGEHGMLEEHLLPGLAADEDLSAYHHDGFWHCMDTFRDYQMLNGLWDRGEASWKTWSD
jgi:glucose-1-phosphate cytidylyltransferase